MDEIGAATCWLLLAAGDGLGKLWPPEGVTGS